LQAYVGLGYKAYVFGLVGLPHSGTECRVVNLEQSNLVLQPYKPICIAYRYVYQQS